MSALRVYRDVEGVRVMSDAPPEHASLPCDGFRPVHNWHWLLAQSQTFDLTSRVPGTV